jgi:uncharacterized protein
VDIGRDKTPFSSDQFLERKYLLNYDHIKFYGGEPLIKWLDIVAIVSSLRAKKSTMKFTIITNWLLLTEDMTIFIKENNISVVISVHIFSWGVDKYSPYSMAIKNLPNNQLSFAFVLVMHSIGEIYKNIVSMVHLWAKNITLMPDSSQLWTPEMLEVLKKVLQKIFYIWIRTNILIQYSPATFLIDPNISCKKTIFEKNTIVPCNRFKKLEYINANLFSEIQSTLESIGFFQIPERFFYSCPIWYFLDHRDIKDHHMIALSYINMNRLFIEFQKQLDFSLWKKTYLTMHPDELRFNLTNQCNLRCEYCYLDFNNKTLSIDDAKNIFMYFAETNSIPKYISFFWWEPLLEFDNIVRIVSYVREFCQKYNYIIPKFKIATNLLLLNDTVYQYLIDNTFEIHISMGWSEQTHNTIRNDSWIRLQEKMHSFALHKYEKCTILLMIDPNHIETLINEYSFLVAQWYKKIHLECIFREGKYEWTDIVKKNLVKQLHYINTLDARKYLVIPNGLYYECVDINVDGSISDNSFEFHWWIYDLSAKVFLDKVLQKIFFL